MGADGRPHRLLAAAHRRPDARSAARHAGRRTRGLGEDGTLRTDGAHRALRLDARRGRLRAVLESGGRGAHGRREGTGPEAPAGPGRGRAVGARRMAAPALRLPRRRRAADVVAARRGGVGPARRRRPGHVRAEPRLHHADGAGRHAAAAAKHRAARGRAARGLDAGRVTGRSHDAARTRRRPHRTRRGSAAHGVGHESAHDGTRAPSVPNARSIPPTRSSRPRRSIVPPAAPALPTCAASSGCAPRR